MHIKKTYKCEAISLEFVHGVTHNMDAIENDFAEIKARSKRTIAQLEALAKKYGGANAGGEVVLAFESDNILKYKQGDVYFTTDSDLALDDKYVVKPKDKEVELEKQMEQEMAAIPGVLANGASVYVSNYGGPTTFRLHAIIGHIDFNKYVRNDFDIPKDISLEEFSRRYIGAEGVNKRAETECRIVGCGTLDDGTECRIVGCGTLDDGTEYVAYQSHGSAAAKKKLITPLRNFVRNFVALPEGKMPNGTPMDISELSGATYTTKATPHPAHVIGSFIDYSEADCLVLDSPDSIQRYSWTTLTDFNKRYTRVSESRCTRMRIKKVFRSEASSKVAVTAQNLDAFYDDLQAALNKAGYDPFDSFDEFSDDLEGIGQVGLFNVASDDEYSAWCDSHGGEDTGYADHYFKVADRAAKKIKAALSAKYTGFDIDSDKDDTQIFVFLTVDAIGD